MTRLLSVALLSLAMVIPVMAQSSANSQVQSDHAWRAMEAQMYQSLTSGDEATQRVQLNNAIALSTLYRTQVNFDRSVGAIIAIHRNSDDALMKSRAVAALQAINSPDASRYLDRHVSQEEIVMSRAALLEALQAVPSSRTLARY